MRVDSLFWRVGGSTLLLFVLTISSNSRLFLKDPSLFYEYRTVSKERVNCLSRLGRYYGNFSHNYFEYRLRGFDFRTGIPKERQWQLEELETERTSSGTSWMDEINFNKFRKCWKEKQKSDLFMTPSHFKTLTSKNKYRLIKKSKGWTEYFDVLLDLNINECDRLVFQKCIAL